MVHFYFSNLKSLFSSGEGHGVHVLKVSLVDFACCLQIAIFRDVPREELGNVPSVGVGRGLEAWFDGVDFAVGDREDFCGFVFVVEDLAAQGEDVGEASEAAENEVLVVFYEDEDGLDVLDVGVE